MLACFYTDGRDFNFTSRVKVNNEIIINFRVDENTVDNVKKQYEAMYVNIVDSFDEQTGKPVEDCVCHSLLPCLKWHYRMTVVLVRCSLVSHHLRSSSTSKAGKSPYNLYSVVATLTPTKKKGAIILPKILNGKTQIICARALVKI